ncbi:hypothetical protein [Rubritepida flocculans]|uniref:hypothetical protein n=1 Tax=Rubritepida flocculans TaxID=182403 RepID=UPI000411C0CF|nr:hypothetical protein [Rubritepida flocculans]
MPVSSILFMALAAVMVLVGLLIVAVAEGYFYAWGLMLAAFGLFYGYGIVKRHYDAKDRAAH